MFLPGSFKCYALSFGTFPHNRHMQKGGGGIQGVFGGSSPCPFSKLFKSAPLRQIEMILLSIKQTAF